MKDARKRKSRPQHPFPYLTQGVFRSSPASFPPTKQQSLWLNMIHSGARLLFDIKAKRGLIYRFDRGIRTLCELTVRSLASLVKTGQIIVVGKDQHLIHYAYVGTDPSWYQPDNHWD